MKSIRRFSLLRSAALLLLAACLSAGLASAQDSEGQSTAPIETQTFTTLHSFDYTDGAYPTAVLVQAANGNLYGTTSGGGANNACYDGCGTIFQITPSGTLTTLYSFCSQSSCADGEYPSAPIQATDGNFYGTTFGGGANGYGTVFKITPSGTLTTLYSFCSQSSCVDGETPVGALVQATDGNFYGTTEDTGANGAGGTIFKISPSGALTTLYSFCSQSGCANGGYPLAALAQHTNGSLYGTTNLGGANQDGTVFKISPSGTLTTLYSFCSQSGCDDGKYPVAGLVQAADANLYGTTDAGGASAACFGGCGTVFNITPSGSLTTLHSFDDRDGAGPVAGLVQGTDGNFYCTTNAGGANQDGTVFKISPSGTLTTLHSFCLQGGSSCTEGSLPEAGLVQATDGNFYGTTYEGGTGSHCLGGCGTVFSLAVGLGPFVETRPTSGKVGTDVRILGTNLTGATSVTFNGTPAFFKVKSSSEIGAVVPSGATTGTVQVVTSGGTLSSNVPFRVQP